MNRSKTSRWGIFPKFLLEQQRRCHRTVSFPQFATCLRIFHHLECDICPLLQEELSDLHAGRSWYTFFHCFQSNIPWCWIIDSIDLDLDMTPTNISASSYINTSCTTSWLPEIIHNERSCLQNNLKSQLIFSTVHVKLFSLSNWCISIRPVFPFAALMGAHLMRRHGHNHIITARHLSFVLKMRLMIFHRTSARLHSEVVLR